MNRKLVLALTLVLVGVAGLIIAFLRSADGDVSLTGRALPQVTAATPDTSAVLPAAADDASRDVQSLSGTVGGLDAEAARLAKLAVRGGVSGRLTDQAGAAVAGEPVWLAVQDDRWEPDPFNRRLPRVASRVVSATDGSFQLTARAGVDYDLHAGGQRWPATLREDIHAGDSLVIALPPPATLEGTVVDADSGQPVEGTRAMVVQVAGNVQADVKSDGSFKVSPLPPADVVVAAWAPGHDVKLSGTVAPGQDPVRLELPAGRTVKGRLIDRTTEKPLANGKVQLVLQAVAGVAGGDPVPLSSIVQSRDATTNDDGRFSFDGAPSMGFDLVCTADGHLPEKFDRYEDRVLDPTIEIIVPMFAEGELAGRAVVAASGSPAEGAQLSLEVPDGPLASAAADAKGEFTLTPPGSPAELLVERPLFVTARAPGLAARARPGGRSRDELLLQLVPVLPLTVQVLDGGKPVQGAEVAARSQGSQTAQGVTDAAGMVSLVHEIAGPDVDRVTVQARRADVESLPQSVDPNAPPTGTLTIELQAGAWIEGVVTDARSGEPVPAALVGARPTDRNSTDPRRSGRSAADGHYRVGPLPAQVSYRVNVSAEGYVDHGFSDIVPGAGKLDVDLSPVVRWEGRALADATGTPMRDFSGQLVELTRNPDGSVRERNTGERPHFTTGDPGGFSFDLPGPGRFRLRLWARDSIPAASDAFDFDGTHAPPFASLLLAPAAVLEITVLDGRSRPVPGFVVAAAPWSLAEKAAAPTGDVRKAAVTGRTDDNGLARLNLGTGGSYRVAGGPGLWLDDGSVSVPPGAPVARLYRLPPTADIEIIVHDDQGNPLDGAMVQVQSSKDEKVNSISRWARVSGDGDGKVVVTALPAGAYDIIARRRGYDTASKPMTLAGNEIAHASFELTPHAPGNNGPGGPGGGPGGWGGGWGGPGGGGWAGGQNNGAGTFGAQPPPAPH